jgi:hypothetical protein
VVDPQAVDDAVVDQRERPPVGVGEHLRVLDPHATEGGDVEEPSVVEVVGWHAASARAGGAARAGARAAGPDRCRRRRGAVDVVTVEPHGRERTGPDRPGVLVVDEPPPGVGVPVVAVGRLAVVEAQRVAVRELVLERGGRGGDEHLRRTVTAPLPADVEVPAYRLSGPWRSTSHHHGFCGLSEPDVVRHEVEDDAEPGGACRVGELGEPVLAAELVVEPAGSTTSYPWVLPGAEASGGDR